MNLIEDDCAPNLTRKQLEERLSLLGIIYEDYEDTETLRKILESEIQERMTSTQ